MEKLKLSDNVVVGQSSLGDKLGDDDISIASERSKVSSLKKSKLITKKNNTMPFIIETNKNINNGGKSPSIERGKFNS